MAAATAGGGSGGASGEKRMARGIVLLVFTLIALPSLLLLPGAAAGAETRHWDEIFSRPFADTLLRSLKQMAASGVIAFLFAWPYGTALALLDFPLKRAVWFVLVMPLLMPPFLWAIGIQSLQAFLSYRHQTWVDGFSGCVLAFATLLIPLVALAAAAGAARIKRSELEAATLHGGRALAWRLALRRSLAAAAGGTLLGSVLTLSDPGCGQIMGYHGAAGEILVAFAARHDFSLATLKALSSTAVLFPLLALAVYLLDGGVRSGGREPRWLAEGRRIRGGWICGLAMLGGGMLLLLPAFVGLVQPLARPPRRQYLSDALTIFRESLPATLLYALVAGVTAAALGLAVAAASRRAGRGLTLLFALATLLFSLPASLNALGILRLGTLAPPAFDFVFRSGWVVGLAKGLHFAPLAIVLLTLAWQRVPLSLEQAARLHGVGFASFTLRIVLPLLMKPLVAVTVLCGLLALADVGSTVLLQPPGESSYGTHLFAVMDNSAEKVVAALCLVYMLLPLGMLLISLPWMPRARRD